MTETATTTRGWQLFRQAARRIPGGTQLLSKRPNLYLPEGWPCYYQKARGVEIVDLDGRTWIDMSMMGIGACVLGYADPEVDEAVRAAVDSGVACTLNAPEEVELAELLIELHPWAQMVRYARAGGEAMAIAVRIARAHTGRDKVAICGYHGWADWYLAANLGEDSSLDEHLMPGLQPSGVPRSLAGTTLAFHYNRIEEFRKIVAEHSSELGVIVMEPQRGQEPAPGFLEEIRETATRIGAVLVFDEITTGFRMTNGGVHLLTGVLPDIAVFAKAIANGYAMSAILGRQEVMQAAQSTFISSTNWTERIGPVAALATIRKLRRENVTDHLSEIGNQVLEGWRDAAAGAGITVEAGGHASLSHFAFKHKDEPVLTTLFTQLMMDRGFLAYNQFKPSYSHTSEHVRSYVIAVREAFEVLANALARGNTLDLLRGPVAQRGFYRLA